MLNKVVNGEWHKSFVEAMKGYMQFAVK